MQQEAVLALLAKEPKEYGKEEGLVRAVDNVDIDVAPARRWP